MKKRPPKALPKSRTRAKHSWQQYEALAAKIFEDLLPFAEVTMDDRVFGEESEAMRQIDVSGKWQDGDIQNLLIVQVKEFKKAVNISQIGQFLSDIADVRATHAAMICSSGFSKNAMIWARKRGVHLYTLHDAKSRNWSQDLTIPMVWIAVEPTVQISFQFATGAAGTFRLTKEHPDIVLSADGGATRIGLAQKFTDDWNNGYISRDPGPHTYVLDGKWKVRYFAESGEDLWGDFSPVQIEYSVQKRTWFREYRPADCRGLIDLLNEKVFLPSFIALDDLPIRRDDSWSEIEDAEQLVVSIRGMFITTETSLLDQFSFKMGSFSRVD